MPRLLAIEVDRTEPPDLTAVGNALQKEFKGASLDDPAGLFPSSLEGKVRRAVDLVTLAFEDQLAGLDDVWVVVDDQDSGHHTLPLSLAFPHGAARGAPALPATVSRSFAVGAPKRRTRADA